MTLETFQAVKLEAPKGCLGRAQRAGAAAGATGRAQRARAEAGCRALEDGSGKEGEPKASGAERAGNIDHAAITVNHSEARRTRQAVDTGPALRFGGSKGEPGAKAGCRALEDGSGKEGEPKASGAERAGNIDHTANTVNHSKEPRTILDPLCRIFPYTLQEKLHFHVALEEVRVTELLSY